MRILTAVVLVFLIAGCGGQVTPTPVAPAAPPLPNQVALAAVPTPTSPLPERLLIEAINLDTPVVELGWSTSEDTEGKIFSEWDVAVNAAGWHKNSARVGEHGNIVMSGHNNILGAVFRELDQLRRGDEIVVEGGQRNARYIVHDVLIVPEKQASLEQRLENAKWIEQFGDDRLTLVSCWPRNDNTHRIIVVAFPAQDASGT